MRSARKIGLVVMLCLLMAGPAGAASLDPAVLTQDLQNLVLQGNDLLASMDGISINALNVGFELSSLETLVTTYQSDLLTVYDRVVKAAGTTMSLNSDMLVALQNLAAVQASLGSELLGLAGQVVGVASVTALTTLNSSLYAMLRLSDDIGVMADRILEMADKILVMADNIGLMADRILATQLIQNTNIELVVEATLQTQQNMLMLFGMFF